MASYVNDKWVYYLGTNAIKMSTDTFKVMLLLSTYTPSSTHYRKADVSAHEHAASGNYSTGGATLGSVTWTESGGTVTFDAADTSWTSATITARYAQIYSDTASNDELVALIDFGADKSVSSGTFTISWHANGIIQVT